MDTGTFLIERFAMAQPSDVALATSDVVRRSRGASGLQRCAAGIPLIRPGNGCTLMLESLVMALTRHMPLKKAAGILRNCDGRLWRVVQCQSSSGRTSSVVASGGKEAKCLNLYYDLDTCFELHFSSGAVKAQSENQAEGEGRGVQSRRFTPNSIGFAEALLAVLEVMLDTATRLADSEIIRACGLSEKVTSEIAMLYPSQSRAPPDLEVAALHRKYDILPKKRQLTSKNTVRLFSTLSDSLSCP